MSTRFAASEDIAIRLHREIIDGQAGGDGATRPET